MAKRRRRTKKGAKKSLWLVAVLIILIGLMGSYVGYHLYQRHVQEQIIEKQQNAKKLFIKEIAPEAQAMQKQYHVMVDRLGRTSSLNLPQKLVIFPA